MKLSHAIAVVGPADASGCRAGGRRGGGRRPRGGGLCRRHRRPRRRDGGCVARGAIEAGLDDRDPAGHPTPTRPTAGSSWRSRRTRPGPQCAGRRRRARAGRGRRAATGRCPRSRSRCVPGGRSSASGAGTSRAWSRCGRRDGRRADPRTHVAAAPRPLRRDGGPLSPDRRLACGHARVRPLHARCSGGSSVIAVAGLGGRALLHDRAAGGGAGAGGRALRRRRDARSSRRLRRAALVVYVTGAVRRPGVVPAGRRRAGRRRRSAGPADATAKADSAAVNLAAKVADGQQIVVPERAPAPPGARRLRHGPRPRAARSASTPRRPSSSTSSTAWAPATAAKIIAWRAANGGFSSVDDLGQVWRHRARRSSRRCARRSLRDDRSPGAAGLRARASRDGAARASWLAGLVLGPGGELGADARRRS